MNAADQALLAALGVPELLGGTTGSAELELTPEERRFQEERRRLLGGTDMAAISGFSTYRNAWDVAAEKKGLLPPWQGNERTEIGTALEDPVARLYAKRTGARLRRVKEAVIDRELPYLGGHPDRLVIGAKKGVEVKTVQYGFEKYSEPGEPQRIPKDYYVQCQTYMTITGYTSWDLVCLFGLSRVRWYTITRNDRVCDALRRNARLFWETYVEGDAMPAMGPTDRAEAYLRERYGKGPANDTFVVATEEQAKLVRKWKRTKDVRSKLEKAEKALKLQLQGVIGDATGIVAGDATVTWKRNRDSVSLVTDWESIARDLHGRLLAIVAEGRSGTLLAATDRLWTTLYQQFTKDNVKPGARVLRVKGEVD